MPVNMFDMKCWPSLAPFGKVLSMPGGDLFYYDSGYAPGETPGDKPAVVLIHGLGDEADTWRHVFPLIAGAGFRVLAPDLPGFGRSNWKGRIGMGTHRKAVLRIMAVAGCPAVLVGSSLGAGIAELVAAAAPDLVPGIILIAGCFPLSGVVRRKFLLLGLPFVGRKWYRGFRKNHLAAWKSLYTYYADLDAMSDADRDFLRGRVVARVESANQERGYLSTVGSMNRFFMFGSGPAVRGIGKFPGRILVLCGEKDLVFPPERAGLFRALRPDAEFATIAAAGHLPQQERPGESAAEILRFLGSALPCKGESAAPREKNPGSASPAGPVTSP